MAIERKYFRPPLGHFFLFGPRGTGKSSWLKSADPHATWIDLLSPAQQRRYAARPERLRELAGATPSHSDVVIDEVQRVPDLLMVVHQLMEEPGCPRFMLTGSSSRQLKRAGVDLLTGRATRRTMHPFIAAELGRAFDLDSALETGLLPLIWDARDPADTLGAYVGLYVQQEVQSEGLVRNVGAFHRFLEAISFSYGGALNVSEIARECSVSRKTVEGFVEIAEDLLLAFRVPFCVLVDGSNRSIHHFDGIPDVVYFHRDGEPLAPRAADLADVMREEPSRRLSHALITMDFHA